MNAEKEIWKKIKNHENYQVSNRGSVRSIDRKVLHRNQSSSFYVHYRGQNLKPILNKKTGYFYVNLNNSQKKLIHVLVCSAFKRNPANKPFVNHKDFNRTNNIASNLEWMTPQENTEHAVKNGRYKGKKGSTNPMSKLTMREVIRIRKLKNSGKTFTEIGRIFNLHRTTISNVCKNLSWK